MPIGLDKPSPDVTTEKKVNDQALAFSEDLAKPSSIEGPQLSEVKKGMAEIEPAIAELLTRYETKRAALLPVLHLAQKRFGLVSAIVQREVAYRLELPPADVSRVVTFYTLYRSKPCGKKVLMVCGTLSCELAGATKVIEALKKKCGVEKMGVPSSNGEYSIERVECLGWCDRAPVMQINESDFFDCVTPEKAWEIAEKYKDE